MRCVCLASVWAERKNGQTSICKIPGKKHAHQIASPVLVSSLGKLRVDSTRLGTAGGRLCQADGHSGDRAGPYDVRVLVALTGG